MLNHLGFLGFAIGLILLLLYIRVGMELANYIGNKFRKLLARVIGTSKKI